MSSNRASSRYSSSLGAHLARLRWSERIRNYRTYLESEIRRYGELANGESLAGSVSATQVKSALEKMLKRLDGDFPELKESK